MASFNISTNTHNIKLILNGNNAFNQIVLCVHGFNGNKWGDAYDKLKDLLPNSMVCSYDMAGHGDSEIQSIDMRLNICLQEMNDVVTYLKISFPNKPIVVVAVSYGAYVTVACLSKFNPDISKVILINPALRMLDVLQKLRDFDYTRLKADDKVVMKASKNKFMSKLFLDDLHSFNLFKIHKLNYNFNIILGNRDSLIPKQSVVDFANKFGFKIDYVDDEHCMDNPRNWDFVANKIIN